MALKGHLARLSFHAAVEFAMVVGLPLDKGDQPDGTHILSVSLTLSCPFSGSHFLGERLACRSGLGGPWTRPTDSGEGGVQDPKAGCIFSTLANGKYITLCHLRARTSSRTWTRVAVLVGVGAEYR